MPAVEQYLKPEVIRQISRLDLRAQFIVKGFLQGLHASPFHGFSVEFSEHRKYTPGDDPQDIDWLVYAKTDKYYIKKFEAETNITGFLVMDLSRSMGYTYRQELTKFDYAICLAAALCYLMIHQQDPVGLITFDQKIRQSLPPRSKRTQLGNVLSLLANLRPAGETDIARSLVQIAAMLRHRSLVMLFTDLFAEPEPVIAALRRLRHGGHDVILFHVLDEAEVRFPFDGMIEFEEPETREKMQIDASSFRPDYLREIQAFCDLYRRECFQIGVDYVPVDTSMQFDRALTGYLASRRARYWMAFVHVAFLGGAVLVAVPIILHLIMRQQPKHLEFPALRFIKLRETANRRQMRLRHWLLLALRAAAIGLLALALARPSIQSSGMLGDQEAPAAAALVFDTNPRMQYRQQNKTRLEAAQETAQWLLPQLPPESDVAVVDSRSGLAAFAVDASAARARIERLDANTLTQPLAAAIESALKLVHDSDKPRKEVYVFTDLARADWSAEAMREVDSQLKEWRDIGVYIVDVGANDPSNVGVGETRLSAEVLSGRSPLRIAAELTHVGPAIQRAVELYLIDDGGEPRLRAQQQCAFQPGESQRVEFSLSGLAPGIHRGYLKVAGEDALACDDVHWFTVQVRPAWRVLLVGPHGAERKAKDYAFFLEEALAPDAFRVQGKAAFDCEVISTDQLSVHSLDDVAAVCLIDPDPLPATTWQKLHSYVSAGGGLGVFLGRNAARIQSFNEPVAQQLLPAALVRQWRGETRLAPDDFQHPMLRKFRALDVAWELSPVFRHWQLGPLNKESSVVVAYSDNQPAVLERPVGKGRVITMTTPVSDPANRSDLWNQLPTGDEPVFVMLANEMLFYLVGRGQERLNYTAGETAVIHPAGGDRYPIYSLATPRGDQIRTPVDEKQNAIVVTSTESPGNYRLQAGGGQQRADLGFSVNLPPDTSRLDRATKDDLAEILSDIPFRLARNRDEIDRSVSAGRVGMELFPYLMLLLAIVLGCEQVLANRFYQDHDSKAPRSRAAELAARATTDHKPADVPVSIR